MPSPAKPDTACCKRTNCLVLIAVVFGLLPFFLYAAPTSSKSSIKEEKRRLARLEQSIKNTRAKLSTVNKKENTVLKSLNLYRRQTEEIESYITLLEREQQRMEKSIVSSQSRLDSLRVELQSLQEEYANLVRTIHKAGTASDEELLVTGSYRGEEQARSKYMQNITALANSKADEIVALKDSINAQSQKLQQQAADNTEMIMDKVRKREELSTTIAVRTELLDRIRDDKSALRRQLGEKTRSMKKVRRIITLLVEKERKRKEEEARRRRQRGGGETGAPVPATAQGGGFAAKSLPWPVQSKVIVSKFGKHRNPQTNTETENLGIGIKTARGTGVKAVHGGTVSLVHWLPGYGSFVIVNHGNNFRTVYGNLSSVLVTEGQVISAGATLGRSGKSLDGEYLHFELWRNREVLNPLGFLR